MDPGQLVSTQEAAQHETLPESRSVAPFLVRALECDDLESGASRHALRDVAEVAIGRGRRAVVRTPGRDGEVLTITVPDARVSARHARIVRDGESFVFEDCWSTNGSIVDGRRVQSVRLAEGAVIEVGSTVFLFRSARASVYAPADKTVEFDPGRLFETLNPSLEDSANRVRRVAASPLAVLLLGETGTGKEVMAEDIHARSGRPGRFVAVNCGAIPATLVEAQLFGHVRGAFTGAVKDELGLVRAADRGTLFLDEIADLPLPSQAALLRVLQSGEVTPVGSTRTSIASVRVIGATHKDLDRLTQEGTFRRDLYARLAGFVHTLPSLRARREDLGLLVATLLRRHAGGTQVSLRVEAARALFAYDFPLNIRELEQTLLAALVLAGGTPIGPGHLPDKLRAGRRITEPPRAASVARTPEDAAVLDALRKALSDTGGNVSESARRLGKARQQVQRWIRRFGLDPTEFR